MMRIRRPILYWPLLLAGSVLAAMLVAACGGGGVDTGGTGAPVSSYSSGRITGFGSIVVNGVHYDESGAAIVDDAGQPRSASELKLGMTVEIDAGDITQDSTGVARAAASRVQFGSQISGPVESVDAAARTLQVLGQAVDVDVNTVIEGYAGLAEVSVSDLVEVHAFFDPSTGRYAATRLERADTLGTYKLRGPITLLNTTAQTFAIGQALIRYAEIDNALPQLENGVMARVELQTVPQAGTWIATRLHTSLPVLAERVQAEVEGYVTGFASLSEFTVDGVRVDASGSGVQFRKGSASQVADGVRIEVEGRVQDGVLVADTVTIKKAKHGSGSPDEPEAIVLEGHVGGSRPEDGSFSVRGVKVVFGASTEFEGGTAADLRGASVVVTGVLEDGSMVRATRITIHE